MFENEERERERERCIEAENLNRFSKLLGAFFDIFHRNSVPRRASLRERRSIQIIYVTLILDCALTVWYMSNYYARQVY